MSVTKGYLSTMRIPADLHSTALETLLARAAERVRAVGRAHRLDPAATDEVFQEVRIRIWKAFEKTPEKIATLPASYVYQTASTAAIDLIRRGRARRADATDPIEDLPGLAAGTGLDPKAIEHAELAAQIEAALGEVLEARRGVVRMHLEGYDRNEIADLLAWTEPKVRNLLYRGLSDLREALGRRGIRPGG
ncbi:MAG: sigma-70 family RNA polymerase sigma factor [Gemmatimonadota bacterium]